MIKYDNVDYAFAPPSYFADPPSEIARLLRNVKGTARRQMIRDYWLSGRVDLLAEELRQAAVSEETREFLGQIAREFMGGEFLPDYLPDEVEIARVELKSTLFDVISIRARPDLDGGVLYRVIDEYDTEFELNPARSSHPFTLEELIAFLDSAAEGGVASGPVRWQVEQGGFTPDLIDFVTVSSEFYPDLGEHYRLEISGYLAPHIEPKEQEG